MDGRTQAKSKWEKEKRKKRERDGLVEGAAVVNDEPSGSGVGWAGLSPLHWQQGQGVRSVQLPLPQGKVQR